MHLKINLTLKLLLFYFIYTLHLSCHHLSCHHLSFYYKMYEILLVAKKTIIIIIIIKKLQRIHGTGLCLVYLH